MSEYINKGRKKFIITFASVFFVLALLFGACVAFVSDYYHADAWAISVFSERFTVSERVNNGYVAFGDENAEVGFIFTLEVRLSTRRISLLCALLQSTAYSAPLLRCP